MCPCYDGNPSIIVNINAHLDNKDVFPSDQVKAGFSFRLGRAPHSLNRFDQGRPMPKCSASFDYHPHSRGNFLLAIYRNLQERQENCLAQNYLTSLPEPIQNV